jgi:hypothetical protein
MLLVKINTSFINRVIRSFLIGEMSLERMLFWTKVSPSKNLILHFSKCTHLQFIMIVLMLKPRLVWMQAHFITRSFRLSIEAEAKILESKMTGVSAFLQQRRNDRRVCIFTAVKKWQEIMHFYSSEEMIGSSAFLQWHINDRIICIFTAVKKWQESLHFYSSEEMIGAPHFYSCK